MEAPEEPVPRESKLEFIPSILEFGILATGLTVQKELWINNLSIHPIRWRIVEVRYYIDSVPYMKIIKSENISSDSGQFLCICGREKLLYTIENEGPTSWVSMLLLLSIPEDSNIEIESLCIVTFEIINYNITINGNSENTVLCPMKILYTGVPHTLNVAIENHSPITGMIWFLPPFGEGTESIDIDISPKHTILSPFKPKSVEIKLVSRDVGIFENIYIPCFVNKGQECLMIRVLCAVDCVHLSVYLPGENQYYQKVMWPPKIIFEYDEDWMICPCTLEYAPKLDESAAQQYDLGAARSDTNATSNVDNNLKPGRKSSTVSTDATTSKKSRPSSKSRSEHSTNDTSKSTSEVNAGYLREVLRAEFGDDLFLQHHVVEARQVQLKTPKKVTFYIENITPIQSSYSVEAINFFTTKSFDANAQKFHAKKTEDIWNDMISNEYGILVLPEVKVAPLPEFGLIEISVTIFANTWGVYMEEIAVDVPDIPCFTFSLLIEVTGPPVIFPMALNKITNCPTIRFGNVSYYADEIQRKLKIVNTSCVPVIIMWHTFLNTSLENDSKFNVIFDLPTKPNFLDGARFTLTNSYMGKETSELISVNPYEMKVGNNCSEYLNIFLKPGTIPPRTEQTYVKCTIMGHIFLQEHHRTKPNYFFRCTDLGESLQLLVEAFATIDSSDLDMDHICGETVIRLYANDVIFKTGFKETARLVFYNNHASTADVELSVDDPLEILEEEGVLKRKCQVPPFGCLEVEVYSSLSYQKLLVLSDTVYPEKDANVEQLKIDLNVQGVDVEQKILHMQRDFKIAQKGRPEQIIPIDLYIHYPNISAKPSIIKLNQVCLGNTRKALVTLFNHTGSLITFEIFKSTASNIIYVTPHYGEIEKSTGTNNSSTNIFIYFTPRETRQYVESIRIVTNIPNYFIEIPIKATGSVNEKFYKDYKI